MARSGKLTKHLKTTPRITDEILDVYGEITIESPDVSLHQIPEIFSRLKIPACFTADITNCVNYYYQHMARNPHGDNHKYDITKQLLRHLTLTTSSSDPEAWIDVVDIDKLIAFATRLITFRDNYDEIIELWSLFVRAADPDADLETVVSYKLTLSDLQKIKKYLDLDETSDAFLIDMLGTCSVDSNGDVNNYDFARAKSGPYVSIKDFAEILGSLGEISATDK